MFQPIACDRSVIKRDIPLMLAISLYLFLLSLDSMLGRIEGATLFAGIILYTVFNYYVVMRGPREEPGTPASNGALEIEETGYVAARSKQVLLILVGIGGVVAGAEIVVIYAERIMMTLGVSQKFIGITLVAFGTSLPELATSIVAALRKEMDISIGNLVGSNVFNILSVLGAASLVRPIPIPGGFFESGLIIDYAVMMFTSILPWFMMRRSATITRGNGLVLFLCYLGFLTYQIIVA